MNLKIKLIVGFRRDQQHSVPADEAHKAYYLFLHPESRGIFNNGLALKGDQIQEIIPDWQGTMGWNPSHTLDANDWNEIRQSGAEEKMRTMLESAKEIVTLNRDVDLNTPLSKIIEKLHIRLSTSGT